MGLIISGIAACETIDSSGEILRIDGLDITSLERDGVFNWEHESKTASSIVGKILKAKKIFSQEDCQNESQLKYWKMVQVPFLWVLGELFDDVGHSEAMNIAAMIRYDMKAKAEGKYTEDMAQLINLSVEGAKLKKDGNIVTRSIARKVSITITPCNKVAQAEAHQEPASKKESKKGRVPDLSIFKSETVALPEADVYESLEKAGEYGKVIHKPGPEPKKGFGKVIIKEPAKPQAPKPPAKAPAKPNLKVVPQPKTPTPTSPRPAPKVYTSTTTPYVNIPGKGRGEIKKAMGLGSGMGAPATMAGDASSLKKATGEGWKKSGSTMTHPEHGTIYRNFAGGYEAKHPKEGPGALGGWANAGIHESAESARSHLESLTEKHRKASESELKKSEAIREYNKEIDKGLETWDKVQHFRAWLSERMPSLSKKEVEAFTRAFVLYRVKKAEKKLKDF
jgi:hypothetical protein